MNTELRSTSLDILSAQVGAAAFYDVGDAKNHIDNLRLKQSVGLGLRVLFPEFDRIVMRADWGFPLSPGYSTFPGGFLPVFWPGIQHARGARAERPDRDAVAACYGLGLP